MKRAEKVLAKDVLQVSRHLNNNCDRSAQVRWKLALALVRPKYSLCTDDEEIAFTT